jgi:hypothetical protein
VHLSATGHTEHGITPKSLLNGASFTTHTRRSHTADGSQTRWARITRWSCNAKQYREFGALGCGAGQLARLALARTGWAQRRRAAKRFRRRLSKEVQCRH